MINEQAHVFLVFIFVGFIIGMIFDIFRVLRKSFKTNDIITYIEDIIFWVIAGSIILYATFKFNYGQIRLYMLLGIVLGGMLYILVFSNSFIKIMYSVLSVIKKVVSLIFYPIVKFISFLINIFKKIFIIIKQKVGILSKSVSGFRKAKIVDSITIEKNE